jgi:hypothetical protein
MPFIDTSPALAPIKLQEGNFLEKFGELVISNGWTQVARFKKMAWEANAVGLSSNFVSAAIAQHYIYKTAGNKYLAMANVVSSAINRGTESTAPLSAINFRNKKEETVKALEALMLAKYEEEKSNITTYFYTLEKLPSFELMTDAVITHPVNTGDKVRGALDIEVSEASASPSYSGDTGEVTIKTANLNVMQSPIAECTLRSTSLEDKYNESYNFAQQVTNWWKDSEIRVKGFIDSNTIFVILQCDNAPAWEDNLIPTIPIYFGKIDPIEAGDDATALFVGTTPREPYHNMNTGRMTYHDFDAVIADSGPKYSPLLKEYPKHPSNGVNSVMVSRSKLGARYQEYYLSWNTSSNEMPPDRVGKNGAEHPRAWNNHENNEYKYQFNPSRYSNKVHTSKIYVVHPEEGVRGSLTKAIGLSALNFNAGKLKVRKENCPEKIFDIYRYFMVDAMSPLTQRPATAYRPMGIGIYDTEIKE